MSQCQKEISGSTSARIVGVLSILNGALVFIVSIFASDTFTLATGLLLIASSLAVLVGIGLINLSLYAWIGSMVLTVSYGLVQIFQYVSQEQVEGLSNIATNLIWPVMMFCLLLSSFKACRATKEHQEGWYIRQFPVLVATAITLVTILSLKVSGNEGFLLLGFPALIIEFGLIYVVGLNLQKKLVSAK
jgi:hypothetical protein